MSIFCTHTRLVLFICIAVYMPVSGVTLVYNLRVRRIFNVEPVLRQIKSRVIFSTVPIYFSRKSTLTDVTTTLDTCEKRRAGGSLLNVRYVHSKHWWMEVTTGIETDHGTFDTPVPFSATRTGFDDIVFASGYRQFFGKKVQVVGYGLVGLPTKRKVTLADRFGPLVGTRFYNLGVGLEGSYSFVSSLPRSCSAILQTRFIHGFNRSWFPILPRNAEIKPGNATDILGTIQYRKRRTIFETGYNATIFSQQALIFPTQTIKTDTFVRHAVYATLSHVILKALFNKPFIFGVGGNITRTKQFDAKTFTVWIFGSVVF